MLRPKKVKSTAKKETKTTKVAKTKKTSTGIRRLSQAELKKLRKQETYTKTRTPKKKRLIKSIYKPFK